jgi:two-component system, cell cycle response regulator
MPRVFTVDDSNTIRTIISKQLTELGFEVEQAEDGIQAFAKLEEIEVDLILLDVTMPNMDGPTFLTKLRETGNKTPVIMLTSESKRQIISGAVKLGIEDYILKPFKPDELKAKVLKALRLDAPKAVTAAATAVDTATPAPPDGSRQFIDVLVIDDMENVHKKLRGLLPGHVSMNGCVSAREALQLCQERSYRIVLIDMVMPDVNSVALMNQLRALQPHTVMVALLLRSTNDMTAEMKGQGFHDALVKPFEAEALDRFLSTHFESNELLTVDGNVLSCAKFDGKDDRLDKYFTKLRVLCRTSLEKLASACYEDSILDLSAMPIRNSDRVVRFVMETEKEAKKFGIALVLVGTADVQRVVGTVADTATLPFFSTVNEARNQAA